jgi:hypothetical protein
VSPIGVLLAARPSAGSPYMGFQRAQQPVVVDRLGIGAGPDHRAGEECRYLVAGGEVVLVEGDHQEELAAEVGAAPEIGRAGVAGDALPIQEVACNPLRVAAIARVYATREARER